jgi:hypothetical protein
MSGGLLLYESPLERVGSAGVYYLYWPSGVCT